jgi:hypothetical protein
MNELNVQVTAATHLVATAEHAMAEAQFQLDTPNPFSGIIVWHSLITPDEGRNVLRASALLNQMQKAVECECKRAVDVMGYITKINSLYAQLLKEGKSVETLDTLVLEKVLRKLSDGAKVSAADRLDHVEWISIGQEAAKFQKMWIKPNGRTPLTWDKFFRGMTLQYREVFSRLSYDGVGGDPTGPAGRHVKFPVGMSFGALDVDADKYENDEEYALAMQVEVTYGKPATMEDYTQLLKTGKKPYGTDNAPARSTFGRGGSRAGSGKGPAANQSNTINSGGKPGEQEVRKQVRKWKCGR